MKSLRLLLSLTALSFAAPELPSVAIMPLQGKGISQAEADLLTETFVGYLQKTQQFRVIERTQVAMVLEEQGFQNSGACEGGSCAVEVGRLLSADLIVVGSAGILGSQSLLNLRIVDVQTGLVLKESRRHVAGPIDRLVGLLEGVAVELASSPSTVPPEPQAIASQPPSSLAPDTIASEGPSSLASDTVAAQESTPQVQSEPNPMGPYSTIHFIPFSNEIVYVFARNQNKHEQTIERQLLGRAPLTWSPPPGRKCTFELGHDSTDSYLTQQWEAPAGASNVLVRAQHYTPEWERYQKQQKKAWAYTSPIVTLGVVGGLVSGYALMQSWGTEQSDEIQRLTISFLGGASVALVGALVGYEVYHRTMKGFTKPAEDRWEVQATSNDMVSRVQIIPTLDPAQVRLGAAVVVQ